MCVCVSARKEKKKKLTTINKFCMFIINKLASGYRISANWDLKCASVCKIVWITNRRCWHFRKIAGIEPNESREVEWRETIRRRRHEAIENYKLVRNRCTRTTENEIWNMIKQDLEKKKYISIIILHIYQYILYIMNDESIHPRVYLNTDMIMNIIIPPF